MEEFIRNITDQIRCAKVREHVAKELSDHILDQAEAYEKTGTAHDEAVGMAVRKMGDPVEIGAELDRIHRPQLDVKMMAMVLIFSIAGLLLQYRYSAAGMRFLELNDFPVFFDWFSGQCFIILISFGVMAGICFLDYSFIGRYAAMIYVVMTVVFFIGTKAFMTVNGRIPALLMLVYLYIPVYAGILYWLRGKGRSAVLEGIGIQIVTTALVYAFSTLHTALAVHLICTVLLILAIHKNWFLAKKRTAAAVAIAVLIIVPAVLLVVFVAFSGVYDIRFQRIQAWLHPGDSPAGAGYVYLWIRNELAQSRLIGNSGSGLGETIGASQWDAGWTNPFILLYIVCSFGILAGLLVVLAFAVLIIHVLHIVRRQRSQLGFMTSASCFMVFLFNCAEGILVNSGYYPVTNVSFPFLSYGVGTTVTYAVLTGLLLSIHRNEKIVTDQTATWRPVWRLSVKLEKR